MPANKRPTVVDEDAMGQGQTSGTDLFGGNGGPDVGIDTDDGDVLDLSGINENQPFPVIAPGRYPASVVNLEYTTSGAGNKMYVFRFGMTDPETGKRRQLFFHATMTEDTMPRLKKTLMTLAPDIDWNRPFKPREAIADLMGREAIIQVETEAYNNPNSGQVEARNRIRNVFPATESMAGGDFFGNS
jgi:hypothetical protein